MLWLKFNIYSLLLSLIALTLFAVFLSSPFFYRTWWFYFIPLLASFLSLKAADIFGRFPEKVKVHRHLLAKAQRRYDQRYFVPYMETACMRHVVFWTLRDLGKQSDYQAIKKRYSLSLQEIWKNQVVRIPSGPPKVMDIIMDQHEMKFVELPRKQ